MKKTLAVVFALLIAGYLATAGSFGPTNPAIKLYFNLHKYDYVDPNRLLAAVIIFPMLAAYWLLLIAPGLESAQPRWRLSPHFTLIVAIIGAWFAAGGTGLLTWLYGRHIAPHALALSLALALCSPAVWLAAAKRPLILCAAISAIAAVSYNVDLFLFGRYVDRHQRPGLMGIAVSNQGIASRVAQWAGFAEVWVARAAAVLTRDITYSCHARYLYQQLAKSASQAG